MPAAPELRHGLGHVRVIEILRAAPAEHIRNANSHIGIAGEIEEQLQREADGSQPGIKHGRAFRRGGEDFHGDLGKDVGDEDFFAEAGQEAEDALGKELRIPGAQIVITGKGAGLDLGEKGEIEGVVERVFVEFCRSFINIRQIGNGFEGEEGNAQGESEVLQGDFGLRDAPPGGQGEIGVFIVDQKPGIQEDAEDQEGSFFGFCFCAVHQATEDDRYRYGSDEEEDVFRAAEGIKGNTDGQEDGFPGPAGRQIIHGQGRRQEQEQE